MRKLVIVLAAVAVFVVGCGGGGSSSSSTPVKLSGTTANKGTKDIANNAIDVELQDFAFSPTFIKGGAAGSTVTLHLKNTGRNPHTFTSTVLAGGEKTLAPGEATDVQVTLFQSGATEFHCRFHQQSNGMQGAFFFKDGDTVAAAGGGSSSSSAEGNPYGPN